MADRNHARAVAVAGFAQLLMGPEGRGADRITGGAVALHRRAGDVFQEMLGAGDAVPEFAAADGSQALMSETMARHFMAGGSDVPYQRGETFGYPAEHEERGPHVMPPEEIQHAAGVAFDPERPARPVFARYAILESRDLEVIFHVHGHRIGDGRGLRVLRVHLPSVPERVLETFAVAASPMAWAGAGLSCSISLSRVSSRINCIRMLLRFNSSAASSVSCSDVAVARRRSMVCGTGTFSRVGGTPAISSCISSSTTESATWSRRCNSSR